jgi:hypothetical protein
MYSPWGIEQTLNEEAEEAGGEVKFPFQKEADVDNVLPFSDQAENNRKQDGGRCRERLKPA